MGGKSGSSKMRVADYYLSMHFGVCVGPVDRLEEIYIAEKALSIAPQIGNAVVNVFQPSLFGGPKKAGGVQGAVTVLMGDPDQLLTVETARRLKAPGTTVGPTPEEVPGFRGLFSIFFTSVIGALLTREGFLWGTNNPSLPAVSVKVRRGSKGLDEDNMIGSDSNPSHMIWECCTNVDWGEGAPESLMDKPSFLQAAATLREEEFGLSMLWSRQAPVKTFITEILDHINATCAVNPRTGLRYLKLLRKDYDVETLRHITIDNANLSNFQRAAWGETINEINVTWTNPANEQEETITVHDNANLAVQQQIVNDGRNYYGVRNPLLARRLGERDLEAAAAALASCDAEVDRTGWDLVPGDCVILTWPEYGIDQLVMRIGEVDYGNIGDPGVKLQLLEDVFGLPFARFSGQETEWIDPDSLPSPLENLRLGSAPYFLIAAVYGDRDAEEMEFPEARTLILASQGSNEAAGVDFLAEGSDITGNIRFAPAGSVAQAGLATLSSTLVPENKSDVFPLNDYIGPDIAPGMIVLIATTPDATDHEICAVETASDSSIVVRRGALDTSLRSWAAGSYIWVIDPVAIIPDTNARAVAQTVRYKFLTLTSRGQLPVSSAPTESVVIDDRQYCPYRPANVKVVGDLFGPTTIYYENFEVTWSRRNRLTETGQVLEWIDGDVTPETGQTTSIELVKDGIVLTTYSGITGTSYTIPFAGIGGVAAGDVFSLRLRSHRDGYDSYTYVEHFMNVSTDTSGYGLSYGNDYL